MSTLRQRAANAVGTIVGFVVLSFATYAEDNTVQTYNGGTHSTAAIVVGNTGDNNSLDISGAATVSSPSAIFGNSAGADNNFGVVTGVGTTWTLTDTTGDYELKVGRSGTGNSLTISTAAVVAVQDVSIGDQSGSTGNSIFITGSNSFLDIARWLEVGLRASSNTLTLSAGGQLDTDNEARIGSLANATNNIATVTGTGSQWQSLHNIVVGADDVTATGNQLIATAGGNVTTSLDLIVGRSGVGNTLTVSAGGTIQVRDLYTGQATGTADNNAVLVTGSGSLLSTRFLDVGTRGDGTTLTISDTATVQNTAGVRIGGLDSSSNNLATVTGTGTNWNSGADIDVGSAASATNNQLVVTAGGQLTVTSADINVGRNGSDGNFVTASAGGKISVRDFYIGRDLGSDNQTVSVTGTGSEINARFFDVGTRGTGSVLTISAGGKVQHNLETRIGGIDAASNHTATVTGTGSQWIAGGVALGADHAASNGNQLFVSSGATLTSNAQIDVGRRGSNNSITVSGGGVVSNVGQVRLGGIGAASNNTVTITGTSSQWNSPADVLVGADAAATNNQLTVTAGGQLTITGADLRVGSNGSDGNFVTVSAGGKVSVRDFYTGLESGGNNQTVLVTGTNSELSARFFDIGTRGGGSTLTISAGGKVQSSLESRVGGIEGSSNNTATVTGTSSQWIAGNGLALGADDAASNGNQLFVSDGATLTSNAHIDVGRRGSNNSMTVSGGGVVSNVSQVRLGGIGAASNNTVTITGTGSQWNSPADILVGADAAATNNQLTVTAGGQLTITGADLRIGSNGSDGNFVTVSAGGKISTRDFYTGLEAGGNNQTVLVTGTGSEINSRFFDVGTRGSGTTLTVSAGGKVQNTLEARIGGIDSSSNNTATVTGTGSQWLLNSGLAIGADAAAGTGNQLNVLAGGSVSTPSHVHVGRAAGSSGSILVDGAGSILASSSLRVGNTGTTLGTGSVSVTNGGTLEVNTLIGGTSGTGTISNTGGVYQFTTSSPTVTPNTAGSITLNNATISYRAVSGADINNAQVGNITRSGNNAFRLNNSSSASVASYTFDSGNPAIYQRLELANGGQWNSTNLTVGTGGAIQGGGATDMVNITGNFTINRSSNPAGEFDLSASHVRFSGGAGHVHAVTGKDFGNNGSFGNANGFTAQNFSYGRLSIGNASDIICLESGDASATNALYLSWLDLGGNTALVASLRAPSTINVYYLFNEPNNAYLNNQVYQLTDWDGFTLGGLLMPALPEPSGLLVVAAAGMLLPMRRRK